MLISVIIPAFNAQSTLARCLMSVCAQTHENLEILVINDGSTDKTAAIAADFAAMDRRIRVITQENCGLAASRNVGIEAAAGSFLGFVDADDEIIPAFYERLLQNALRFDAQISSCGMMFVYPDGRAEQHGSGKLRTFDCAQGLRALLRGALEPSLCNKLYAAEILQNSCLNEKIRNGEDLLRNFTAFSRANGSIFDPFCGYRYHQSAASMSKNAADALAIERDHLRTRRLILEHSSGELQPDALCLLLNGCINTCNRQIDTESAEILELCDKCRVFLRENRENWHLLNPRRRIAAYLLTHAPRLHRALYRLYRRRYAR